MKLAFISVNLLRHSLVLSLICIIPTLKLVAQADTIYPYGVIYPSNILINDSLNFPMENADPIGDINGDSLCDFVIYFEYALNDQSSDPDDYIPKSAIVTDINKPDDGIIYYNANIQGIGDYNGDGFDDMIDFIGSKILFGNVSGQGFESIDVDLPSDMNYVQYLNDITEDSKSDFIVCNRDHDKGIYVFSEEYDTCQVLLMGNVFGSINPYLTDYFDFDNDDKKELFLATYENDRYIYAWFKYDTINSRYQRTNKRYKYGVLAPYSSFSRAICDLNGDSNSDLCFVCYYEGNLSLEVLYGNDSLASYFEDPVLLEVNNENRLLYHIGDINRDGYDDWYSKSAVDTIVYYLGNSYIKDSGFIAKTVSIEGNNLLIPLNGTGSYYPSIRLTSVFDYNYDSYPDFLMNYWSFDESNRYDTAGMIIFTGNDSLSNQEKYVFGLPKEKLVVRSEFGSKILNVGDFNNDGFEDWAVMAVESKYLNIYFGGETLDYDADITILLPQYRLTDCFDMVAGDLNNDNWIDIAVSHGHSSSEVGWVESLLDEVQEVLVFYGTPDIKDTLDWRDAQTVIDGKELTYWFGRSMSIPGDYNNDGFNDLVVGGGLSKGFQGAYLYYGADQLPETPSSVLYSYNYVYGYYFGFPATSCGDINGDGFRDLTLGAGYMGTGKSLVFLGGPNSDSLQDFYLHNTVPDGRLFGSFTPLTEGDFDNDGYSDIVQANPYNDSIFIYRGGDDFDSEPDIFVTNGSDTNSFISNIVYINDFSVKGKSDLILCGSNNVGYFIYEGSSTNVVGPDYILKTDKGNARSIASGDFNNDGRVDVFTGNPYVNFGGIFNNGIVQHYISLIYVGIDEKPKANNLVSIYPNPSKSIINVEFNSNIDNDISITLVNSFGKVLKQKRGIANQVQHINISDLPSGLFIIYVEQNGSVASEKFIKVE